MRRALLLCAALAAGLAIGTASADAPAAESIAWSRDLTTGLAEAKATKRLLMVCVNAKVVEGRADEESAAKALREVVYLDARVVKRSRDFVCVLLATDGDPVAFAALRALGVAEPIVSPQHVFVSPNGDRLVHRKEYWPYGKGEPAVTAMLALMDRADELWKAAQVPPDPGAKAGGPAPAGGDARAAWIAERVALVSAGGAPSTRAIQELMAADHDGDCSNPLIALLPENAKNAGVLVTLVRALGRNGLVAAAGPISELLDAKDDVVVANAAVSLEYIGSGDKRVISALRRLADRTKDEAIANHAYRALGRSGYGDAGVRALLLDRAGSGKSEFATYGPCIGLAYFERDDAAMRGVEKILKTLGIPGSRRGGGGNTVKRAVVSWTLASIGDQKSAKFVREELVGGLKNVKAFWVAGLVTFWSTVADVCDGQKERLAEVEIGVRGIVQFAKTGELERYGAEVRTLDDDARKGREGAGFTPKGDGLRGDGGK
jgi:hypothetical protein